MLRVIGYQPASSEPASEEAIVMDEWGLINVTWGQARPGVYAWWRTGDDARKSFLEIGLDPDSGVLCSLALILVPFVTYSPERRAFPDVPQALGLPICDLRRWEDDNHLTDPSAFEVSLHNDCLAVALFPGVVVSSVLIAGRTRFGLDAHGGLVSIEVVALSAQEQWTLREYHTVIGWTG